ncbi:Bardet-Biedl syndrome 12 protein homolog%2C partial [Xyrichtys novacula]|uniref:Bardet-Biedl syndrome 12 protein homolog, partial n=1 Tax=Xyrichtys novacula TaxID=13765 RepID=A0AAV1FEL6_XYRNO|nr:Bardet-Biedl syndrome 12 protein homolog%2C partial [Xyrichtys novacula]
MLGSTIINHQQHVGLQKLSALAGLAHSFLGPNKKYKFIQDDTSGESVMVCSCFRILENLELTCSVGQLIYETVRAHQKVHHTGSGCLLFLAGVWSRVALEFLHRGIPVASIILAMSEGMDICMDVCRKSSVSIDNLDMEHSQSSTALSGLQLSKEPIKDTSQAPHQSKGTINVGHKSLKASAQRKIKLSRHFCEPKSENMSTEFQNPQPKLLDIAHIAECLSHGCVEAMNLVVECSRIQSKSSQQDSTCSKFNVSKVMTCVLPGLPEEEACTVQGCILLLSADQASVAHHLKDQLLKVVLIDGDLSGTYRHLGFKRLSGIQFMSEDTDLSSSSKEENWMEKVITTLMNLEVNLILISGLVGEKVIQRCSSHHILAVEKVKVSVLNAFADSTGAVPVTYVTQLSKSCVGAGVKLVIWRDLSSYKRKSSLAVNISTGRNIELVTVVVTSCIEGKLQALEDQFWTCAYRVHHALKDRALLPGAGVMEMLCAHHLQNQAERDPPQQTKAAAANPYRSVVLHHMAEGLIDYISTVMVNTGKFSKLQARTAVNQQLQDCNKNLGGAAFFSPLFSEAEKKDRLISSPVRSTNPPAVKVYDNLSVKQEAWRKALDLVFLVLQSDAEVITGIDQTEAVQKNLMLL